MRRVKEEDGKLTLLEVNTTDQSLRVTSQLASPRFALAEAGLARR